MFSLCFSISDAKKYGLLEAILLNTIASHLIGDGNKPINGRYWIKPRDILWLFDFTTKDKLADAFFELQSFGAIVLKKDKNGESWVTINEKVAPDYNPIHDAVSQDEEKPCSLYYILNQDQSKVKIGISNNPKSRLKNMQTSTGDDLELLHTIEFKSRQDALAAESFLHELFERYRVKKGDVAGKEWFNSNICNTLFDNYYTYEQFADIIRRNKV